MIGRKKIYLIAFSLSAMATIPWGIIQPRALDDIRNLVFDAYQRQSPRVYDPHTPIRVVGIDEESLGLYGQWPWPRKRLAELTHNLNKLGASAIVFDLIFSESDRAGAKSYIASLSDPKTRTRFEELITSTPDGDKEFIETAKVSPIVLGEVASETGTKTEAPKAGFVILGDAPTSSLISFRGLIAPFQDLYDAAGGLGATNWLPDHDQVVRRVPLIFRVGNEYVPGLALEALRIAQGASTYILSSSNASRETSFGKQTGINSIKVGEFEIPTGPSADVRPRYSYAQSTRDLSTKGIIEGTVPKSEIEGRIIFIGARAMGLGDVRATPLEATVAGVDIQAQLLESLLSGALLTRPDWAVGLEIIMSIVSFCLTMGLLFFTSPVVAAASGPLIVLSFIGGSFALYEYKGLLIDPAYPSFVVVGGYLIGAVTLWRTERIARDQVRFAFGKFLAPAVVEQIAENPEKLVLGGETRDLSILFCDLRNFSSISQGMTAPNLAKFMNDYFTLLTDDILNSEGTIDKYIGDAVLAFWNAPLEVKNHQYLAASAALAMRKSLKQFNDERRLNGREKISFGIGLHSGQCSVGNMGSSHRFDYTILGDAVNLASRIESACKKLATDILATEQFVCAVPEFAWLDLGLINVEGRANEIRVFSLVGNEITAQNSNFLNWQLEHNNLINLLNNSDYEKAKHQAQVIEEISDPNWNPLYANFLKKMTDDGMSSNSIHSDQI